MEFFYFLNFTMKSIVEKKDRYNWCVTGTLDTHLSSSDLWNIISRPSNLELFHPFCDKNLVIAWPGVGSIDQIFYYNGLVLERNFISWVENKGYDLLIGKKNGELSFVSWQIKENGGRSKLSISIYPYAYNKGRKLINILPYLLVVKPILTSYINSVMRGLEHYINTNRKVKKNQFGNHNFFSN